ncbi:MAG: hypothetical protein HY033_03495 [Ignavibacteriae bacterium]|nr:hypothetical protein [Ignavibacteriota bacterium]
MKTRSSFFAVLVCLLGVLLSLSCKQEAPTENGDNGGGVSSRLPLPPNNFVATAISPHEIDLRWSDTTHLARGYVLLSKEQNSTEWQTIDSLPRFARLYRDAGLQCQTTYVYQIYAYNQFGQSTESNPSQTTTEADSLIFLARQSSDNLYGVAFSGIDLGIAVGANGTILGTSDGASTWQSIESPTTYDLHGVAFNLAGDCMMVGDHATVLYLHDGQVSTVLQTAITNGLRAVVSLGGSTWVIVGEHGIVLRTFDDGTHWVRFYAGVTAELSALAFVDAQRGIAVGTGGTIVQTTDGGLSWAREITATSTSFYGLAFSDSMNGAVVGADVILHTSDGGKTWTPVASSESQLNGVGFLDTMSGVAVGSAGIFYQTKDGGVTWTHSTLVTRSFLMAVQSAGSARGFVAVGLRGTIVRGFPCDFY